METKRYYSKRRLSSEEMCQLAQEFDQTISELGIARIDDSWVYALPPTFPNAKAKDIVRKLGLVVCSC